MFGVFRTRFSGTSGTSGGIILCVCVHTALSHRTWRLGCLFAVYMFVASSNARRIASSSLSCAHFAHRQRIYLTEITVSFRRLNIVQALRPSSRRINARKRQTRQRRQRRRRRLVGGNQKRSTGDKCARARVDMYCIILLSIRHTCTEFVAGPPPKC